VFKLGNMKNFRFTKNFWFAASLLLLAGCVRHHRPIYVVPILPPGTQVIVNPPSPPPGRVEPIPARPGPATLWVWVPGRWEWQGYWVWRGGYWAARTPPHVN
jgi:hypothetical protein